MIPREVDIRDKGERKLRSLLHLDVFVIELKMGACVSTSNQNSHSRRSIGEPVIPHLATDFSGQNRSRGKLVEHQVLNLLQHLPSVPGRIFGNGKTKSSCLFTQQGCKGINQDAMIVWEVSCFLCHLNYEFISPHHFIGKAQFSRL